MSKQLDMTPPPDLSQKTGTGPVRTRLPVWRPALPPCNHACPAGENIQAWLALAEAGRFEAAWQTLIEENPLPAVHGRVCYHPCESACNRAQVDDAVSIHAIERFLGDEALARGLAACRPCARQRQEGTHHRRRPLRPLLRLAPQPARPSGGDP